MSDYLSGQVTFSGLGSGTDFTSIIKKLVEVEGTHKKQMESWKSDWTSKMGALTELNTSMTSMRTTLVSMDTMNTFMIKNATASDSTVLTATASSDTPCSRLSTARDKEVAAVWADVCAAVSLDAQAAASLPRSRR
jgi:flagellar hook-associated protein 2